MRVRPMTTYDPDTYWPARYDQQGETYVARAGEKESHDAQLKAITPYFSHLPTDGRVLDYGCGPGRFRAPLERRGLEYEGVDLIPECGTMDMSDIESKSFDCAVAIFVLQHIVRTGPYAQAVGQIWRALKYGGRFLVVDHQPDPDVDWDDHMNPRGPEGVQRWGWKRYKPLGEHDGHWVGMFEK